MKPVLEVIVCSVDDAISAERGGAGRLEVISNFEAGGLTPPSELVREIAAKVRIPLRVMVRETENFFIKDEKNIERLCEAARSYADLCVDGLVIGFLQDHGSQTGIDHESLARVLSNAPDLKATFHRAFELLTDPRDAITELKLYPQIDRILTSGGDWPWPQKIGWFTEWQKTAWPEIMIIVGGGVSDETIRLFRRSTTLREFHVGRAVREGNRVNGGVQEEKVRALVELIEND